MISLRFWIAVCFFLGVATGVFSRGRTARRGGGAAWLLWTGAAAMTGVSALLLGAVTGRTAYYLLTGIAFYVAFLPGAAVGAHVAGRDLRAHEGWAMGLAPLCLIWITTIASGLLQPASAPAQKDDRDATGTREAPESAPVAASKAQPAGNAATPSAVAIETPTEVCRRRLAALADSHEMTFAAGKSGISRRLAIALDAAAIVIRDCRVGAIEIAAGADGSADPESRLLAQKRAAAAARYLRREGLAGRTVQPVDAGANAAAKEGSITFIIR